MGSNHPAQLDDDNTVHRQADTIALAPSYRANGYTYFNAELCRVRRVDSGKCCGADTGTRTRGQRSGCLVAIHPRTVTRGHGLSGSFLAYSCLRLHHNLKIIAWYVDVNLRRTLAGRPQRDCVGSKMA